MRQIRVVENTCASTFENEINELLKNNYKICSSNCGCLNSGGIKARPIYSAILRKQNNK